VMLTTVAAEHIRKLDKRLGILLTLKELARASGHQAAVVVPKRDPIACLERGNCEARTMTTSTKKTC
jgi:hypothetical protein